MCQEICSMWWSANYHLSHMEDTEKTEGSFRLELGQTKCHVNNIQTMLKEPNLFEKWQTKCSKTHCTFIGDRFQNSFCFVLFLVFYILVVQGILLHVVLYCLHDRTTGKHRHQRVNLLINLFIIKHVWDSIQQHFLLALLKAFQWTVQIQELSNAQYFN